jgi:hypothetical protein
MSHPQGVGPERRREEFALALRESHPGHPPGSAVA